MEALVWERRIQTASEEKPLLGHTALRSNLPAAQTGTLSPQVPLVGIWYLTGHGQLVSRFFWEKTCGINLGLPSGSFLLPAEGEPGEIGSPARGRGRDGFGENSRWPSKLDS